MNLTNKIKNTSQMLTASSFLLSVFLLCSCKKNIDTVRAVSLNVVNASPGTTGVKIKTPNITATYYSQISNLNYGSNRVYTLPVGSSSVTMNLAADTLSKPFYSGSINASAGDIYSLYIGGAAGDDIILQKESLPAYYADSSLGVRFINMSYNSSPVNVTLSTSTTINEFSNVAYKSATDFKTYDARSANPSYYTFQVRDGAGNMLASVSVSSGDYVWYSVTLVLSGEIGGTGTSAPKLFIVKSY